MSTFDGYIKEFPDITIDHFSHKQHRPPPRAAFLSHIHKDHMTGLERYDSSFIYCSQATKDLVLRLQTKRDRLNLAQGMIERKICTYANLQYKRDLLKPLPLNTPTWIEVGNSSLRVTLLDANHCPGATMFLIEGDGKSVLYTGDIRAEPWWVQSLANTPILSPYIAGIRFLDCLYLDTTFASLNEHTRKFPQRAASIQELIQSMKKYPKSTIFHFNAWTFGYEDLWVAVAAAFGYKIHVDRYRYELFGSIKSAEAWTWGPLLRGHVDKSSRRAGIAGHVYEGALTEDPHTPFHSCDSLGTCPVRDAANVVQIIPVTTTKQQTPDVQPDVPRPRHELENVDSANKSVKRKLEQSTDHDENQKRPRETVVKEPGHTLLQPRKNWWVQEGSKERPALLSSNGDELSYYLRVALSRHSSLDELRDLVSLVNARDIFPCVEDPLKLTYLDLEGCFGDLCDLTNGCYARKIGYISNKEANLALERVLEERWAYDDISDDESEVEEDEEYNAGHLHEQKDSQDGEHSNPINRDFPFRRSSSQETASESDVPSTMDDNTEDEDGETERPSQSSLINQSHTSKVAEEINISSQESTTVLFQDTNTANAELVNYYFDLASKGTVIELKSVVGTREEVLF